MKKKIRLVINPEPPPEASVAGEQDKKAAKPALLHALGERVRLLRARKGFTRRMLADEGGISERHLSNLENGVGNFSIMLLHQVAMALSCSISELLGDEPTNSPERLMIRELLYNRPEEELKRAHEVLRELFIGTPSAERRAQRIALVGLRGAGKSTLGAMLAEGLSWPLIELGREITRLAGCSPSEIQALYGPNAYRRYERLALKEALKINQPIVIAAPGGLVSDPATFDLLLTNCFTVWLQATPEDHMNRVIAQGDLRPMADSKEAMDDLRMILKGRAGFYAKADLAFDTSGKSLDQSYEKLMAALTAARSLGPVNAPRIKSSRE